MVKYTSHKGKNVGSNPAGFNVNHYNLFIFNYFFDLTIQ